MLARSQQERQEREERAVLRRELLNYGQPQMDQALGGGQAAPTPVEEAGTIPTEKPATENNVLAVFSQNQLIQTKQNETTAKLQEVEDRLEAMKDQIRRFKDFMNETLQEVKETSRSNGFLTELAENKIENLQMKMDSNFDVKGNETAAQLRLMEDGLREFQRELADLDRNTTETLHNVTQAKLNDQSVTMGWLKDGQQALLEKMSKQTPVDVNIVTPGPAPTPAPSTASSWWWTSGSHSGPSTLGASLVLSLLLVLLS